MLPVLLLRTCKMTYDREIRDLIQSETEAIVKLLNTHACIDNYAEIKAYNKVAIYAATPHGAPYVLELVIKLQPG